MATGDLRADIVFHDPFPRGDYIAMCVRDGREVTEEGYEQWRDTCERLSGDMSTERRIAQLGKNLGEAFAAIGASAEQASTALGALAVAIQQQPGLAKKEEL